MPVWVAVAQQRSSTRVRKRKARVGDSLLLPTRRKTTMLRFLLLRHLLLHAHLALYSPSHPQEGVEEVKEQRQGEGGQ
jgi:hypothetical protein